MALDQCNFVREGIKLNVKRVIKATNNIQYIQKSERRTNSCELERLFISRTCSNDMVMTVMA